MKNSFSDSYSEKPGASSKRSVWESDLFQQEMLVLTKRVWLMFCIGFGWVLLMAGVWYFSRPQPITSAVDDHQARAVAKSLMAGAGAVGHSSQQTRQVRAAFVQAGKLVNPTGRPIDTRNLARRNVATVKEAFATVPKVKSTLDGSKGCLDHRGC